MQRIKTITAFLDVAGAGGLIAAGAALANLTGVVSVLPEAQALSVFLSAFLVALAGFGTARLLQIGDLIRTSANPRRDRLNRAAVVETLPQTDANAPVPNPFQRAA